MCIRDRETPARPVVSLYPGMVIVTVGPPRGIDLPGCDAHTSQGCRQKGRFFPAAAVATLINRQRCSRPVIGRAVGGLFRTPPVYLQHRLLQAFTADSGPKGFIKKVPAGAQFFCVDPRRQHIEQKQVLRKFCTPGNRLPQEQSVANCFPKQFYRIISRVRQRHGNIQVFQQQRRLLRTSAYSGEYLLLPGAKSLKLV